MAAIEKIKLFSKFQAKFSLFAAFLLVFLILKFFRHFRTKVYAKSVSENNYFPPTDFNVYISN